MILQRKDIEIMSPAGNFECLAAAVQGGADAVYFGAGSLNMRSRSANNFAISDLPEAVNRCGEKGVKTYLTVNTIVFDDDMAIMRELIDAAADAGVSAVIVSDPATIMYASKKGMEIHLSTQINITNFESLRFYSQYADVAVLARELTLDQVKHIYGQIAANNLCGPGNGNIRLEMFAHGALCMAVSGKCYLSLHEYNASANRGSCYQVCRRSYTVTDRETGRELEVDNQYIMSPKDLCTIDFMDRMLDAGVRVFKIEGRARSAEYVKTVTRCYSQAADAIVSGDYTPEKIAAWKKSLSAVFNRGFWDGYYLGRRLGEWSETYGNKASKRKTYVGKVTNFFAKVSVAEILIESDELVKNDEILIIGSVTGVVESVLKEIRVEMKPVEKSVKGEYCSVPVSEKVRRGDKLYKLVANEKF
ncbi:MAG: U32 family peptidase [Prevotellaceae bacterium]|jgi:putative protease|nr:U32 family peptidase [Prevotellaceae bacterium]